MIFVTVGSQMSFNRMVRVVDEWAAKRCRSDVFAQIGSGEWTPKYMQWTRFLEPHQFREKMQAASLIVAHAGMGSILAALELGKPILVIPRRADLQETRTDHQIATARRLLEERRIAVAFDERELVAKLDEMDTTVNTWRVESSASTELLSAIRGFINGKDCREYGVRRFDGVICFGGEDWWYHNRGHYDMQMMQEISKHVRIIYVNSIGMRMPSVLEGRIFLRRLSRKLRSFRRGFRILHERFAVFSPIAAQWFHRTWISKRMIARQVRSAAERMGIRSPLVWVACPPALGPLQHLKYVALIYQRTDRYEYFPNARVDEIKRYDSDLKRVSDLSLFCSSYLYEDEKASCRRAVFVDHGVDFERFSTAGQDGSEPHDLRDIPRPRVGFVGGMDSHTFNPQLFLDVASRLPNCSFVLVGACSLPKGWCRLPNVHFVGQRAYEKVPGYMASCDVLIMPWRDNEWIRGCNPVKLKEYLAVGRPVVSTRFEELRHYEGLVHVANNAGQFADLVMQGLRAPRNSGPMRERVRDETWQAKAERVLAEMARVGIQPIC